VADGDERTRPNDTAAFCQIEDGYLVAAAASRPVKGVRKKLEKAEQADELRVRVRWRIYESFKKVSVDLRDCLGLAGRNFASPNWAFTNGNREYS
jgi:hypothetical protein